MIRKLNLDLLSVMEARVPPDFADQEELARRCGAIVPRNWPRNGLVDLLTDASFGSGASDGKWEYWYALGHDDAFQRNAPVLVGGGATSGPLGNGAAAIAFSVLPQFHGRGYATAIAAGLVEWIFSHTHAKQIMTEVSWCDPVLVHILSRLGFHALQESPASKAAWFLLRRENVGPMIDLLSKPAE
jgi:RimJ/RimL family protein N-acetyltransferase